MRIERVRFLRSLSRIFVCVDDFTFRLKRENLNSAVAGQISVHFAASAASRTSRSNSLPVSPVSSQDAQDISGPLNEETTIVSPVHSQSPRRRHSASPNHPPPPPPHSSAGDASLARTGSLSPMRSASREGHAEARVSELMGGMSLDTVSNSSSRSAAVGGSRRRRNSSFLGSRSLNSNNVTPEQVAEINAVIPEGWEARVAQSGRVYFCNHVTRTTQWERPTVAASDISVAEDDEGDGMGRNDGDDGGDAVAPPATNRRQQRQAVRRQYESRGGLFPAGGSLPPGWERKVTPLGQVYYLDHNTRTSTWHDPRQPRVVNATSDLGPLPRGWEMRQNAQGRNYFVDHNSQTTQFADPRLQPPIRADEDENVPQFQKDLKRKLGYIRSLLRAQPGQCDVVVRRQHLFEDSYKILNSMAPDTLKRKLNIRFRGEEGLDYGGISREWFYLLSHDMLNPYYGLFQYSRTDLYTLQINPGSHVNPDHLSYFMFVGRVIGMAVFHGYYIDGGFIMPFYKQMLGKNIGLNDMESVDPDFHRSLKWVL